MASDMPQHRTLLAVAATISARWGSGKESARPVGWAAASKNVRNICLNAITTPAVSLRLAIRRCNSA